MKKRFTLIMAIVLAFAAIFAVGCKEKKDEMDKNIYESDYKTEATAEQIQTLNAAMGIDSEAPAIADDSYKFLIKAENSTMNFVFSGLLDMSGEKPLVYASMKGTMTDETAGKTTMDNKFWFDGDTTVYMYMKTEAGSSNSELKYKMSVGDLADSAGGASDILNQIDPDSLMQNLKDMLDGTGSKIYADGNKYKIEGTFDPNFGGDTAESTAIPVTVYILLGDNGVSVKVELNAEGTKITADLRPTTEKVSLPKDADKYTDMSGMMKNA